MKFFRYDSPFWSVTGTMFDLMLLNALWFVTSLPIITIGASTSALLTMTMKLVRKEEPPVLKTYFQVFCKDFWKKTALWGISVLAIGWLLFGAYVCNDLANPILRLALIPELTLLLLAILTSLYLLPAELSYHGSFGQTMKTAAYLAILRLPYSMLLLLLALAPVAITLFVWAAFPVMLFYWLFFGIAGIAYGQSLLFRRILPQKAPIQ